MDFRYLMVNHFITWQIVNRKSPMFSKSHGEKEVGFPVDDSSNLEVSKDVRFHASTFPVSLARQWKIHHFGWYLPGKIQFSHGHGSFTASVF